ncbi:hypothetical protein J31TS4_27000 [Paenibacillus sp. J31TS4]|uniref:GNAT family N-acetyltransferase n=1 Tax=Paenibacillus sp. J31TS4 TaxID=2807195 RepID=UPI001B0979E8|nr:N-acetyltransferase [Paenibacillus sp. J31TS4]GIP39420.1 hypothetical protein J31TS4_27000 [Paenibacillus sp. J31TS4]
MQIDIRSETPEDAEAIAELHALAFDKEPAIPALVALHRQRGAFDPELSLVAVREGRAVGHVLFFPRLLHVGGQAVRAVVLSPLAVHPDEQRQGIGARLVREGHRRAGAKGYAASLVLGHPGYYPRFGYVPRMYGTSGLVLDGEAQQERLLEERPVRQADAELLERMWSSWFAEASLAFRPEQTLLDWIAPSPAVRSVLLEERGEAIAYLRYRPAEPHAPILFLSKSREATEAALAHVSALTRQAGVREPIRLPLPPGTERAREWMPVPVRESVAPWEAAMLLVLDEACSPVRTYVEEAGTQRPIGTIVWPVEFDSL